MDNEDTENAGEENIANAVSENETISTLYNINVEIMVKDFVNQKNGMSKQTVEVRCNAQDEFLELLWPVVQPYIEKELVYIDATKVYEWNHNKLNQDDIQKFVIFQDKTSKRTYEAQCITRKLMKAWINKTGVTCFVHVYGNNLKMKKQYDKAFKDAIQPGVLDRAGATNNVDVFKCIETLKSLHKDFVATEASWLRWANWIMKQPGHERENLMAGDPPVKPNLFPLFKVARNETEHLQEIRKGIAIGKRVNEGIANAIPAMEDEIDSLIELFKAGLCRAERIKNHLLCLKTQLAANDNLMDGFSESIGVEEDDFSADLLLDINNVDDIDHQQFDDPEFI